MSNRPVQRWTSSTEMYDVATGGQITKTQFKNKDYIVIARQKHTEFNELKTAAHVIHILICKINPQLKIQL